MNQSPEPKPEPKQNQLWKNKNDYVYRVLCIANIGNFNPDYQRPTVVYQNPQNLYVYTKTVEQFKEKMTYLSLAEETDAT